MWSDLSPEGIASYFASFERLAFRLETQPHYTVDYEAEEFRRFLAGGPLTPPPEIDWFSSWLEDIERLTKSGRRVERVRVIDSPPTPYQRWELWAAPYNIAAGEKVSVLERRRAEQLELPRRDWWLFDQAAVVLMDFDDQGRLLGLRHSQDPGAVSQYARWSETASSHGAPATSAPLAA